MRVALARGVLVLAGALVGLGAAEGLSRLAGARDDAELFFAAPDSVPDGFYRTDRELLMVPAAEFDGWSRTVAGTVRLRTNRFRLRGPDPGPHRTPRWLGLGDSFTLAIQVEEAATWTATLGEQARLQVLNAGVDGYSTWQAARRYARLAPGLQTDGAALVLFLGNDLHDNETFLGRLKENRGVVPNRPIPRPPVAASTRLLMRWSHAYVRYRVWRRSRSLNALAGQHRARWRDELQIFSAEGAARLDALLPHTRAALAELRQLATSQADPLVVAVAPPAIAVHPERLAPTFAQVGLDPAQARPDAPATAVLGILEELGIPACDLTGDLQHAARQGEAVYLEWDGHWTAAGHRAAGEALARCIAESS